MKKFSNRYIFIYSAVLVAVVAVVLTVVAVAEVPDFTFTASIS